MVSKMSLRINLVDNIRKILNAYNDLIKLSLTFICSNSQFFTQSFFNSQFFASYRNLFLRIYVHHIAVFMCWFKIFAAVTLSSFK
jgi:hypothetical protein